MAHQYQTSTIQGFFENSCLQGSHDYWNLDDIVAEEDFVPCIFKITAKGMGYLNLMESFANPTSN
jgi:hypothetical protein